LKRHGGKKYLAKKIVGMMPRHLVYCEPFFGGGQVFFARDPADRSLWWDQKTSDRRHPDGVCEVINDLDGDLATFFRVLADPELLEPLLRILRATLVSQRTFRTAQNVLRDELATDLARAVAMFIANRQSRQALGKDFVTPVLTRLRGGRCEHANAWWSAIESLRVAHRRLRNVLVLNDEAVKVIRAHDEESTFFYLDPPYPHATRTAEGAYGAFEMTDEDHRELLFTIRAIEGKVIISGRANELYDQALAGWHREAVAIVNHASANRQKEKKENEVLWWNY
jgi:DNA adenine methylase